MSLMNRLLRGASSETTERTDAVPADDSEKESLARWQRVVAVAPDNLDARLHVVAGLQKLGTASELQAAIDETEALFPEQRRAMFMVARYLLHKGENESALTRWLDIESRWPDDLEAIGNVGHLMIRLGRPEEALAQAEKLMEGDADRATRLRIRALSRLGRAAEAIEELERVQTQRELEPQEQTDLVNLHFDAGNVETSAALATKALEQDPGNAPLVRMMVRIHEQRDEREEALALLTRSPIEEGATSYKTTKTIGLMIALEQFDDADRLCQASLDAQPDDANLLLLHARCAQARVSNARAA